MKSLKRINVLQIAFCSCIIFFMASCSRKVVYLPPSSITQESLTDHSDKKQLAFQFVTTEKGDVQLEAMLSEEFVSFDQAWNGGKTAFIQKRNSDDSFTQMRPVRVIQDDSLVAVHSRMLGDTLRFRWDILRFNQTTIVEHWSNVNDSIGLNPDGHSEIDGPTQPEQFDQTDTNRAHVTSFIEDIMIKESGGAGKFFNFGLYIQHNRDVGDGLLGLLWGMRKMKKAGKIIKFKENFHIIAEGNFVLSATEGYVGDEKTIFYDFFRIEENKIVEHWDIIAPVNEFIYFKN
ncbi:MAG: hypothetical protein KJ941_10565 [Bacteroidetes bacterium]|nr:hypothetical protein [Bacteroidota bacterium]